MASDSGRHSWISRSASPSMDTPCSLRERALEGAVSRAQRPSHAGRDGVRRLGVHRFLGPATNCQQGSNGRHREPGCTPLTPRGVHSRVRNTERIPLCPRLCPTAHPTVRLHAYTFLCRLFGVMAGSGLGNNSQPPGLWPYEFESRPGYSAEHKKTPPLRNVNVAGLYADRVKDMKGSQRINPCPVTPQLLRRVEE